MPTIVLSYPCHEPSKRPRPIPAPRIWDLAWTAREQLFGRVVPAAIKADDLMRRCDAFQVNGVRFTTLWDRAETLADDAGQPALGLCDYDDANPEQIMISISKGLLEDWPHVAATTAAHEIGHAVFDLPAGVREGQMGGRAASHPPRSHPQSVEAAPPEDGVPNWAEFRANEFMGGFMVPARLLHKRLIACAGVAGIRLVENQDHHGIPGLPVVPHAFSSVTELLADEFGVSQDFIVVRLAKYRLTLNRM